MEVLKTISPELSPAAPHERPRHTRPSSRARIADAEFIEFAGLSAAEVYRERFRIATGEPPKSDLPFKKKGVGRCHQTLLLQKLLRFIQPALLNPELICGRGLHRVNTGLHRTGGFLAVTKPGVRPADQV